MQADSSYGKSRKKSIDITTVIRFKLYPGGYLTGNIAIRLIHPTDQTKENHGKNLTTGNIFKTIVYFALPYLLSYFLQTLYGMADLFIIGQFDHVDAITAVSNGSQVMHMLTVIIVGLAMGATVTISRAVGADRKLDAARAIGNTVTLFMAVSILFTLLLLLLVRPIVVLIGIPTEAVTGTTQYLIICFIEFPLLQLIT